jgi:hypothetical protein
MEVIWLLPISYILGYPLYWLVGVSIIWLSNKGQQLGVWFRAMSAKMDADPHFLPWRKSSE